MSIAKQLLLAVLTLCVMQAGQLAFAQQPQKPATDDVLRVNTDLVQTAITVIDKQGRFVDGLGRDQFELTVDGKPRPISFFERVSAGSPREEQLTAAPDPSAVIPKPSSALTAGGRSIIFFIDDMHMSPDSLHRTRDMLRHFLSSEMSSGDSVVIASPSGQVGFLEQFTNNAQVLNAAIERLSPRQYEVRGYGTGSTVMREYDALIIDTNDSKKANSEILNYYIRECVSSQGAYPRNLPYAKAAIAATCDTQTRNSARAVLMQAATITQNMYASLETLMRSMTRAPGRKLMFFISDGFLMNDGPHAADLRGKLDAIIDTARRSGVVAYTIDSRGLINNDVNMRQASARPDFGAPLGEIEAQQDAMNALAEDTGGRALRNMNYFENWVGQVLDETSNYYLVAWRPEADAEKLPKFRAVTLRIVNRPELTVRAPRGYVEGPTPVAIAAAAVPEKLPANHAASPAESELRNALSDFVPSRGLPTALSLTFLNTPKNEMLLTSSIQITTNALDYGSERKQPATIKLAGVILNDKGKIAGSFKNQLNVNPIGDASDAGAVIYNDRSALAPGIYQVRVAARDEKNGHVGSAMQWIVIPNLTTHQLTTSSVLLGGQVLENKSTANVTAQVQLSVDHRFARQSRLGYWIFAYNAKRDSTGKPNLVIQSQVIRDGKIVLSSQPRTIVDAAPDPDRIAFGDQLLLNSLSPGRYDLKVTVTDALAGTSTTQTVDFEVR
ncbi:MAG TPA: VWA domain-containing protein [Pyrinomonadaceae bacterium]|nr:VWA domain-containing protein [Pyrinomonadaceae bacterium]